MSDLLKFSRLAQKSAIRILPLFTRSIPGPVISSGTTYFEDRYSSSLKWYLPEFILQDALNGGYSFCCKKSGKTTDEKGMVIDNYSGEIHLGIVKKIPQEVVDFKQAHPELECREIDLNDLKVNLQFALEHKDPLVYVTTIAPTDQGYMLRIVADELTVLTNLYKILSDASNKAYCSLSLQATYFSYNKKSQPLQLKRFNEALMFNPVLLSKLNFTKPEPAVQPVSVALHQPLLHLQLNSSPLSRPELFNRRETLRVTDVPVQVLQPVSPADEDQYDSNPVSAYFKIIGGLNYDCTAFPNNYMEQDPLQAENKNAFACSPPFNAGITIPYTYVCFNLLKGNLSDDDFGIRCIYRNQKTNSYLVVPERYVIALDDPAGSGQLVPSAYLSTTIDLNNPNGLNESSADFRFNIAPALSSWQLRKIKELIAGNLPAELQKTAEDIHLEYPQKRVVEESLIKQNEMFRGLDIPEINIVNIGKGLNNMVNFNLEFCRVPIGNGRAGAIARFLKNPVTPLIDSISWEIDAADTILASSALSLSLHRIAGEGLQFNKDPDTNAVFLVNETLYDIQVRKFNKDSEQILQPAVQIPANASVDLGSFDADPDPLASDFDYIYVPKQDYVDQILKEIRFNTDDIDDDVIVTNNTGIFSMYHIKQIDFQISIIKPGETDPEKTLLKGQKCITQDGVINHIPFSLPLTVYLSKWSAIYSTIITFQDKDPQANPAILIEDLNSIGKIINLTTATLNLVQV